MGFKLNFEERQEAALVEDEMIDDPGKFTHELVWRRHRMEELLVFLRQLQLNMKGDSFIDPPKRGMYCGLVASAIKQAGG